MWASWGDSLVSRVAAIGVVAMLAGGVVALGEGFDPREVLLGDGAAWVTSEHRGEIVHVNGTTGTVDWRASLPAELQGDELSVVQNRMGTWLVDETREIIWPLDPVTLALGEPRQLAADRVDVVAAGSDLYEVAVSRISRLDPVSLEVLGDPVELDDEAVVATAGADDGRLLVTTDRGRWLVVEDGVRSAGGDLPGDEVLVSATADGPVVYDPATGTVHDVTAGGLAERGGGVEVADPILMDPSSSSAVVWIAERSTGRIVGVDRDGARIELAVGRALAPPLLAGPDTVTVVDVAGRVTVVDLEGAVTAEVDLDCGGTPSAGDVDGLERDGVVILNRTDGDCVVVSRPGGTADQVDKASPGTPESDLEDGDVEVEALAPPPDAPLVAPTQREADAGPAPDGESEAPTDEPPSELPTELPTDEPTRAPTERPAEPAAPSEPTAPQPELPTRPAPPTDGPASPAPAPTEGGAPSPSPSPTPSAVPTAPVDPTTDPYDVEPGRPSGTKVEAGGVALDWDFAAVAPGGRWEVEHRAVDDPSAVGAVEVVRAPGATVRLSGLPTTSLEFRVRLAEAPGVGGAGRWSQRSAPVDLSESAPDVPPAPGAMALVGQGFGDAGRIVRVGAGGGLADAPRGVDLVVELRVADATVASADATGLLRGGDHVDVTTDAVDGEVTARARYVDDAGTPGPWSPPSAALASPRGAPVAAPVATQVDATTVRLDLPGDRSIGPATPHGGADPGAAKYSGGATCTVREVGTGATAPLDASGATFTVAPGDHDFDHRCTFAVGGVTAWSPAVSHTQGAGGGPGPATISTTATPLDGLVRFDWSTGTPSSTYDLEVELPSTATEIRNLGVDATSHLESAQNGVPYRGRVREVLAGVAGPWGPWSDYAVPIGDPDPPTGARVTRNTQTNRLDLTWTRPEYTGGAALVGYDVRFAGATYRIAGEVQSGSVSPPDITNGSDVRIRTVTDPGNGERYSTWATAADTPQAPPGAPTLNAPSQVDARTFNVSGRRSGGPVDGFRYRFGPPGSLGGWNTLPGGDTFQFQVSGGYAQQIRYEVQSGNAAGWSPSASGSVTTDPEPASARVSVGPNSGVQPGCSSGSCQYVVVHLDNFPSGSYQVEIHSTYGTPSRFCTVTVGSGRTQTPCYFGHPGHEVWIVVNGGPQGAVTSPRVGGWG